METSQKEWQNAVHVATMQNLLFNKGENMLYANNVKATALKNLNID